MKKILLLLFICLLQTASFAQIDPGFLRLNAAQKRWVDSTFSTLSQNEKIGQLVMVAAFSDPRRALIDTTFSNPRYVAKLIEDYKIGGVVFFQGAPVQQANLTNRFQKLSKTPLLIAMDSEWGIAMRLDSTVRFPYQMTLGAMQGNDELIYKMGQALARHSKRLGMHVNFAPVADVNNNPNNPVINFRSFGENKYRVFEKAYAYMKGMDDGGLLTSAKHFPGHGDTGVDSHADTPVIPHNRTRIDSLELYPFRELIKRGLSGVMTAHLSIPALDTTRNLPATLSRKVVTDLLQKELNFKGLVYSDAMNMKGLTKYFPAGKADARGLEAGMDVLEFSADVPKAIEEIKNSITAGRISQNDLDTRVRKILAAKAWAGLNNYKPIDTRNLVEDLNDKSSELLNRLMAEKAVTVLGNANSILPLRELDTLRIASVSLVDAPRITQKVGTIDLGARLENANIGRQGQTAFQRMLGNFTTVEHFVINPETPDTTVLRIKNALKNYNLVVVGVHLNNIRPGAGFGTNPKTTALAEELAQSGKAVVALFGNAYALGKYQHLSKANALVLGYQLSDFTEEAAAQLIFGAIAGVGKLPVTVNETYKYGMGINTPAIGRLKYTIPEEVGINSKLLTARIDSIANVMIVQRAAPGCVIQLAKDGKVFFRKSYGKHTYEGSEPTQLNDLFDLASVTKISTSTPALMKLFDEGKFDPNATLGAYVPEYKKTNKANLVMRDVLTHQARLKAWIPFWKDCLNADGTWKPKTFSDKESKNFPILVTENLYLHKDYRAVIFKAIKDSPLNATKAYEYSDLSFYLYPQIVKQLTGEDFEPWLKKTIYQKIGANTLTFNPLRFYNKSKIVPSEYDSLFRKTLIRGRVHDEGAAMLGGVSGHAGLFGTANDLMKLTQMYLQKGQYGGQRILSQRAITEFTSYQFPDLKNNRGLGFEKPPFVYNNSGYVPRSATAMSYGHTGFTGTMTWVDPVYGLNYVFLSNRVYPTRNNPRLQSLKIRAAVMQTVYDLLLVK